MLLRTEEDVHFSSERCSVANTLVATISYDQIIALYQDKRLEFGVDETYVFEGYVLSSDADGNFVKKIFIQEGIENSIGGFQVLIDEENIYENFQVGDKVLLKLNNLYLHRVDGVYTIGYPYKESVQEIEEGFVEKYIQNTHENSEIIPRKIALSEASVDAYQNTLVTVENIQLKSSELGSAFAFFSGDDDGSRRLQTCDVFQEIVVDTEGTASFSNEKFPDGKGSITGVLHRENTQLKIKMRSLEDVFMDRQYEICEIVVPKMILTEVADPENNVSARFVELYNAGEKPIVLNGWRLHKYLNGAQEPSGSGIDLSGFVIEPKGFLVIANTGFETVFGIVPQITSTSLSGNGDDVYQLVDEKGAIQDVYGEVGLDGSGTHWDYVDGKAIRKLTVTEPNAIFESNEWEIFSKPNDSEQIAPEDFHPNVR